MKKLLILFVAILSAKLFAGDVVIAENGQARAEIVIPDQPSVYVQFAAEELKGYLNKITGGDFKITSRPTSPVTIRLGQSPEAVAAGLNPEKLKRDGFFISAKGNDIFIVGVDNSSVKQLDLFHLFYDETQRGTLLGAYEFLEQFGVRWPAPGPGHELVPNLATLKVAEGLRKVEPFFQDRQLGGFWDFLSRFPDAKEYGNGDDIFLWGLRMKLSDRSMVVGAHSEHYLRRPDVAGGMKDLWADHPERFALIKGVRNPNYSCWTDPAVAEMWKKAADAYFSGKTPAEAGFPYLESYGQRSTWPWPFISKDYFTIHAMDANSLTDGCCHCQRCDAFRKKYPCQDDSELIWKVIVEVAESIKEKHPGKIICSFVYPPTMQLPKHIKLPDNIRVRICFLGPLNLLLPNTMKFELDRVKLWSSVLGCKPPLWTYQCEAAFGRKLPGVPETYPHLIAEFLKIYRNEAAGMFMEQHALSRTCLGLDAYITARLLWNPDRNVDEELSDYFKSYYGPAAAPAQKLFKRFEDNWIKYWKLAAIDDPTGESVGQGRPDKELQKLVWSKVYPTEEIQTIDDMVAAVEKSAGENPVYRKRAGLLRPWIFDIMKAERAEAMNKEEARRKVVAQVPILKAEPTASDWVDAPVCQMVSAKRVNPQLAAAGQFQLLRAGGLLHLRAELKEPALSDSLTQKDRKPGDTNVWQDNDVEIFIYSTSSKDLWQIIVNDQGNWASQKVNAGKSEWMPMEKLQVKVSPSAGGWRLDATIPLEPFGDGELRFNLARNRQIKGQPNELSTWSPLAKVGGWHDPENYGTLSFSEKP